VAEGLRPGGAADELMPPRIMPDSQGVMASHLRGAEVITADGDIDPLRLAEFQAAVALVPYFHAEEAARQPAPKAKVVFTVPPEAALSDEASHMRRQLVARVGDALASVTESTERVLLAGPYWSQRGTEQLNDAFDRAVAFGLPVTLAGAADTPGRSDLLSMRRFAGLLADRHPAGQVTALQYIPPKPNSLFHAKLALGRTGYLGSASFTGPGLGEHVEAGARWTRSTLRECGG
jgi:hypothetical protein